MFTMIGPVPFRDLERLDAVDLTSLHSNASQPPDDPLAYTTGMRGRCHMGLIEEMSGMIIWITNTYLV